MKGPVFSLLALVITSVLLTPSPGDGSTVSPVRDFSAVLGQSVTLRCPGNLSVPIIRLYIQRKQTNVFINGFDDQYLLKVHPEYRNRTKVNRTDLSMKMSNISISDEGSYMCVIFYSRTSKEEPVINLKVTAEYSVPTVKAECGERIHSNGPATGGKSCQLSCSSTGGYPLSVVEWPVLHQSLIRNIENKSSEDPHYKTWTINQTIMYSCDKPTNVSCSIGSAVSHPITICQEDSFPLRVIAATAVVMAFVLILILGLVLMKCCRRRLRPRPEDPALEVPLA
ncbi:T-lymphocyte activation antigen CD80 isoform X2 [Myxocyprinus asiaticus]|nr:T-lymphocyte activation antigen CD80 isoform X2 [Myxocyprinus asiaticus]